MVTIGGTGAMLLGVLLSGLVLLGVGRLLRDRVGSVASIAWPGLVWAIVVIALVTLMPDRWNPGIVPAETRSPTCSTDYGGPAPEGFWIFGGTQRLLNTLLFVPAGALLVLAVARWRAGWWLVPLGLVALAAYSVGIEWTQLAVARIDRACDVTDIVDNVTGALVGSALGLVLALMLQPWRDRRSRSRGR